MTGNEPGLRVKLLVDYTHLDRRLPAGVEGTTVALPMGKSAFAKNSQVRVAWETGTIPLNCEVQRHDLEIVDERFLAWKAADNADRATALEKHVQTATLWKTRTGRFVELVVEYNHNRVNDTWKKNNSETKTVIEDLEKRGLLEERIKED